MGRIRSPITSACQDRVIDLCPEQPLIPLESTCDKLDVMFVIGRNDPSLYVAAKNGMKVFADEVAASTTDYQLGLIVVDYLGVVTEEQSFSLNNVTAFKSTVDSLSNGTNSGDSRDINGGLEDAVAASGWRSDPTVRKYIFLIDDFLPGGNNDTYSATDENELLAAATNGAASDIITSALYLGSGFRSDAHTSEARRIYQQVATNGGGVFRDFIGTLDFGAIFREALDSLCNSDGGSEGDGYVVSSHLHCCRTANCRLCLYQDCYDSDDVYYSYALWDDDEGAYVGTINGSTFRGFWAIRTDCWFFVEIDGVIVGAWPMCGEYGEETQSCMSLNGTVADAVTGTYSNQCVGDLTFETYEPKTLRRSKLTDQYGEEYGCYKPYCGNVDCTCSTLCVTVTRNAQGAIWDDCYTQGSLTWDGEGDCGAKGWAVARWSGMVTCSGDDLSMEVNLVRRINEYTGDSECWLVLEGSEPSGLNPFSGEVQINDAHFDLSAEIEIDLGDYTTLSVVLTCLICGTCQIPEGNLECCEFNQIGVTEPNPITAIFCGVSTDLAAGPNPDLNQYYSGSYDPNAGAGGGGIIDVSFGCIGPTDPFYGDPDVGQYQLCMNCNDLGPNPVCSYADQISCDPFVVVFTIDFDCPGGVCEGVAQPMQVVVFGDTEPLPP